MAQIFKFPKKNSQKATQFSRKKLWVTSAVGSVLILVLGTLSLQRLVSQKGQGRLAQWLGNTHGHTWVDLEEASWEGAKFQLGGSKRMPSSEVEILRFERNPASEKLDELNVATLKNAYRILWAKPSGESNKHRGLSFRIQGAEKISVDSKGVVIEDRVDFLHKYRELFPVEFSSVKRTSSGRLREIYRLEKQAKPVGQIKFDFDTDGTLTSFRFSEAH